MFVGLRGSQLTWKSERFGLKRGLRLSDVQAMWINSLVIWKHRLRKELRKKCLESEGKKGKKKKKVSEAEKRGCKIVELPLIPKPIGNGKRHNNGFMVRVKARPQLWPLRSEGGRWGQQRPVCEGEKRRVVPSWPKGQCSLTVFWQNIQITFDFGHTKHLQ